MRLKKNNSRREVLLFPPCLEEFIAEDNIVRLIDAFVNILDLEQIGFIIKHKNKHQPGAPQYAPSDLLKIYLYGYINRTRSSRQLAKCCQVNIEMMWLVNGFKPSHATIANFRKINPLGIKQAFRSYNQFLQGQDLFGKQTVVVDSSKFRAQNSKRNNLSDRSIKRHQEYIDKKLKEYFSLLDETDEKENRDSELKEIKMKIESLVERKTKYDRLKAKLEKAKAQGEHQISLIDKDARLLTDRRGNKGQVGYNVQSAVDDKYKLIVCNEVTNTRDQNALYSITSKAKKELKAEKINVLADTGYDTAEELYKCAQDNITTFVAPRNQEAGKKDSSFKKDQFIYDETSNTYTCPKGNILTTNNRWYIKQRKGRKDNKFKEYKAAYSQCVNCRFSDQCAGARLNRNQGRVIERYIYSEYKEANQRRVKENKNYYLQRQMIVEHPFGTIKRQWGYTYTLLKGKKKVASEFNLIGLVYNIRRSVSILGVKGLITRLQEQKTA